MIIVGPDHNRDGVVHWRRVDLKRVIEERCGVSYQEGYVSTLLKRRSFSHVSTRPRHPGQDPSVMEVFKKFLPAF